MDALHVHKTQFTCILFNGDAGAKYRSNLGARMWGCFTAVHFLACTTPDFGFKGADNTTISTTLRVQIGEIAALNMVCWLNYVEREGFSSLRLAQRIGFCFVLQQRKYGKPAWFFPPNFLVYILLKTQMNPRVDTIEALFYDSTWVRWHWLRQHHATLSIRLHLWRIY